MSTVIGEVSTDNAAAVLSMLGAYSSGGTDVAIADGGTGASTISGARTNLGLAFQSAAPLIYQSANWYGFTKSGTISTAAYSVTGAGTIMPVIPFYLGEDTTFTDIGTTITTTGTATALHLAVFTESGGVLTLVPSSDVTIGGIAGLVAITEVSGAFSPALALTKGKYWLGCLPNGSITTMAGIGMNALLGSLTGYTNLTDIDITAVRRLEVTGLTYGAIPSNPGSLSRNGSSSTSVGIWLKKQ